MIWINKTDLHRNNLYVFRSIYAEILYENEDEITLMSSFFYLNNVILILYNPG